jgi:serine protease inhibitor
MKTRNILTGFVCLLFGFQAVANSGSLEKAVKANNEFGFEFYKNIKRYEKKGTVNRLVSPISGYMAISMVDNGARSTTEEAIRKTIAATGMTRDELNASNRLLLNELNSRKDVQLELANSIWTQQGFDLLSSFRNSVVKHYDAEARELDLTAPTAAEIINQWCAKKTHDRITKVLEAPLGENFYLVNATYFKGSWRYPFLVQNTRAEDFYAASGRIRVPTMHNSFFGKYLKESGYEVAELSYGSSHEASLLLIVPDSLEDFESKLDAKVWEAISEKLSESGRMHDVTLSLPKFKFEYESDLKPVLSDMGMAIAFNPGANFLDMTRNGIYLSKALQKTFIQLDEKGTEAAAVTVIGGVTSAPMYPKVTLKADKPFLVAIRDNESKAVLFIGAVGQP